MGCVIPALSYRNCDDFNFLSRANIFYFSIAILLSEIMLALKLKLDYIILELPIDIRYSRWEHDLIIRPL